MTFTVRLEYYGLFRGSLASPPVRTYFGRSMSLLRWFRVGSLSVLTALGVSACSPGERPSPPVAVERSAVTVVEVGGPQATHPALTYVGQGTRDGRWTWQYSLVVPPELRLRQVNKALEFLNDAGVPQFRFNPPSHGNNGVGVAHAAYLTVEGCLVDRNPAPPWGRTFSHPITTCTLYISSDSIPPMRDAYVESAWETPLCLAWPRAHHGLVELANARLLVAGGQTNEYGSVTSAEIYDPATGTWADTAPMNVARLKFRPVLMDDGRVLATQSSNAVPGVELWDPATGIWTNLDSINNRNRGNVARLPNQRVIIAGGYETNSGPPFDNVSAYTTRFLDLSGGPPGVWSSQPNTTAHFYNAATLEMRDGRVVFLGGRTHPMSFASTFLRYDSVTNAWQSSTLGRTIDGATADMLPDGHIALVGGIASAGQRRDLTFLDPVEMTRQNGPSLVVARNEHASAMLPSGVLVVLGGTIDLILTGERDTASIEFLRPGGTAWQTATPLPDRRVGAKAHVLANRDILVVGGGHWVQISNSDHFRMQTRCAHVTFNPAAGDPDPGCFVDGDCTGGRTCVDGVCCDSACTGACQACSAYKKGYGSDGVCEPIAAGRDPEWECATENVSTCGTTGACDGAGACARYPDTTVCQASSCVGSTWTLESKCASGVCTPDGVIPCPNGFACVMGACGTFCMNDTHCATGRVCQTGQCISTGGGGMGGGAGVGGAGAGMGGAGVGGIAGAGAGGIAGAGAGGIAGAGAGAGMGGAGAGGIAGAGAGGMSGGGGNAGMAAGGAGAGGSSAGAGTGGLAGDAGTGSEAGEGGVAGEAGNGGEAGSAGEGNAGEASGGSATGGSAGTTTGGRAGTGNGGNGGVAGAPNAGEAGDAAGARAGGKSSDSDEDAGCGCRVGARPRLPLSTAGLGLAWLAFAAMRRRRRVSSVRCE
jgi:MYXO-CTERM domain-containing protein